MSQVALQDYPKVEAKKSVSPSAMNRYFGCGAQWRYDRLFDKNLIPQVFMEMKEAHLGTNFHNAIIPSYFEGVTEKPTPKEIEDTARASFDDNFDKSLWSQEKTARQILENFIAFEKARAKSQSKYLPEFVERKFEFEDFSGIIDFYSDGTIIDWKTGASVEMTQDLMRQGRVYQLFAEREKLPLKKVIFPALQIGKVLALPSLSSGWIESERRRYLAGVELGNFHVNRTGKCRYCPYILRCFNEHRSLWE
jgi:hypothetical protein